MSNTLAPSVTHRDPKGSKFMAIIEAAYNKAGLKEDEAQRVNETPGLADLIGEFIAKARLRQEFADEEVESRYGYLSGYQKPNSVTEQANRLRELFPGIGYANEALADAPVPQGAEGKFVIPRWQKIAPTYNEVVEIVLGKLREAYGKKFYNYIDGKLGAKHLREGAAKKAAFRKLGDEQKDYDLLVVDGQFGILHRGRSVRRARVVMESSGQFGFGAFEVGIMLLTHANRLRHYDDLWIDCAGDEYSYEADGQFPRAPFFNFYDGRLEFGSGGVVIASGDYGSSSGFIPQESSIDT